MQKADTIIVGGGMAGLTAAAYLAKSGKKVLLFEKEAYLGGLVNSFRRKGILFDGGLRSIENSGIVFPMLQQLGIEIEWVKSEVSLVVGSSMLRLSGTESMKEYQAFLEKEFPKDKAGISKIMGEIHKITKYMDVLYGIDNPLFKDIPQDREFLFKTLLPWLFKFLFTIRKIEKLNEPVYDYLRRFTDDAQLIDNIAQHFFKATPTSFALSYWSLYNDYHYPIGGTQMLPRKVAGFAKEQGAELKSKTVITRLQPEQKWVIDSEGNKYYYDMLIWACDQKTLYRCIESETLSDSGLRVAVKDKLEEIEELKGAESVFTTYFSINKDKSFFAKNASAHCFFTPRKEGLSIVKYGSDDKESIKAYLKEFVKYNTFEISIPALRDPALVPDGQAGLEVSLLFEYDLMKKIADQGWKDEFTAYMEDLLLEQMEILFPGVSEHITDRFSSSPLTIERYTGNSQGAIVGWSFKNPQMPAIHSFRKVAKSVLTPIPDVFQAGQWTYSPAGLPISILTGKLAADKVLKAR